MEIYGIDHMYIYFFNLVSITNKNVYFLNTNVKKVTLLCESLNPSKVCLKKIVSVIIECTSKGLNIGDLET